MQERRIQIETDVAYVICIDEFKKVVQQAYGNGRSFEDVPFINAFLRAAQGFNDGLPLHYPRRSPLPDPEGENFKWFGEEERGALSAGRVVLP